MRSAGGLISLGLGGASRTTPTPDAIAALFTLADGEVDVLTRLPTPTARLATAIAPAAWDVHHANPV